MPTKEEIIKLKALALDMAPKERPYISNSTGFAGNMANDAERIVMDAEYIYKWLIKEEKL